MIRSANLLQEARRADGLIGNVNVEPDWPLVVARVRSETTGHWDDAPAVARFEGRGGRFVRGRGALSGPKTVVVDAIEFEARRGIITATGSTPTIPPIPGLADVDYWTTHEAISTEELPRSLIVLGGGAVGCELGQVFGRLSVEVTIVEGAPRILPGEEPEASQAIMEAFEPGVHGHPGHRWLGSALLVDLHDPGKQIPEHRVVGLRPRRIVILLSTRLAAASYPRLSLELGRRSVRSLASNATRPW